MKKLLLLLLFPFALPAQSTGNSGLTSDEILGQLNTISTAAPFLRIAPDARAGGMGDGSVALSNDANAMFWNPSRLTFNKKRFGFAASYAPWLRALVPGMHHAYTALYFKPDSVSAIGASFRYFGWGKQVYYSAGNPVAVMRPWEMAVDIGYSRKIRNNISLGLTARYIQSTNTPLYGGTVQGFAADAGATWVGRQMTGEEWQGHLQAGLAITNIGAKMNYMPGSVNRDFLPTDLALAMGTEFEKNGKHFFAVQVEARKLLVPTPPVYAIDTNGNPVVVNGQYVIVAGRDPNRSAWEGMTGSFSDAPGGAREEFNEITWSAGVEYDYKHFLKARAGIFYENEKKGNRQYATFGVGVRYKPVALDISYLLPFNAARSPLENTWKLTLLVDLNSFRRQR
jgi:hypothetical protein